MMKENQGKNNSSFTLIEPCLPAGRSSFTLIELLVVLALVAILSVVVVVTLNPAELIKQARDSNRLSDLSTINTALNLFSADVTSGFMGTSTVVYVSIPDNASSTCGSLGLPALPTGYTYNCVTTASLRNTNGTGWIPVNFQRISSNSPISQLPIDPQNTTSTRYYTYVTGGSWQLSSKMESSKYQATTYTSGGADPSTYTIGNNLSLAPFVGGLVGWWKFEEGSGATITDSSGYGNNGIWHGTGPAHYSAGKVGAYAGNFNGTNDNTSSTITIGDNISLFFWIKSSNYNDKIPVSFNAPYSYSYGPDIYFTANKTYWNIGDGGGNPFLGMNEFPDSNWRQIAVTNNQSDNKAYIYIDGNLSGSADWRTTLGTNRDFIIGSLNNSAGYYIGGLIDDVRVYNRVLSPAEVLALYNATK